MLFAKRDPLQWKRRFAYFPTMVGFREDDTPVKVWWKPYESRRRTDLDSWRNNIHYAFERRMIDAPPDVQTIQIWAEYFEGYTFWCHQPV